MCDMDKSFLWVPSFSIFPLSTTLLSGIKIPCSHKKKGSTTNKDSSNAGEIKLSKLKLCTLFDFRRKVVLGGMAVVLSILYFFFFLFLNICVYAYVYIYMHRIWIGYFLLGFWIFSKVTVGIIVRISIRSTFKTLQLSLKRWWGCRCYKYIYIKRFLTFCFRPFLFSSVSTF